MIKIDLKALILVIALLSATSSVAQMSNVGGGGTAFTGGTVTSPIIYAAGSSSNPSIAGPTNDTGIYFSGAGYMLYTTHANGLQWQYLNTGITPTDNSYALGSAANRWTSIGLSTSILFGSSTNTLTLLPGTQTAAENLTFPVLREAETVAIKPQNSFFSVAAPGGVAAASSLMAGLSNGVTRITPQVTGNLYISCVGMEGNGSIAGITTLTLKYGTGNGPANQAAATGTSLGQAQGYVAETAAGKNAFAIHGIATGLTLGTAYYIDILIGATTGTGTIYTVDCVAWEL